MKFVLLLLFAIVGLAGAQTTQPPAVTSLTTLVQRIDQNRLDIIKLNLGGTTQLTDNMASLVAEFNTLIQLLQKKGSASDILASIQRLKSKIDAVTNSISTSTPNVLRLAGPILKAFNTTMGEATNTLVSYVNGLSGFNTSSATSTLAALNASVKSLNDTIVRLVGMGLGIPLYG